MKALSAILAVLASLVGARALEFPPGWLPVAPVEAREPAWSDFRKIEDRVHLYLPGGDAAVRGVFVCFVFHSADPRELARLWNFALVTVPWPMEYDLGHNDKRSGRFKLGHPVQDMGLLLRYLEQAAADTGHPELASVPIVGWLGQNGSHLGADLFRRAPGRVLAWADAFPNRLRQDPVFTEKVPFAFAWEISKEEERARLRAYRDDEVFPRDLSCRANTYGYPHGIYSKFQFFAAFLDRCIQLRMPEKLPPPGSPVILKPVVRSDGWVGDFDPISEWNPIFRANTSEAEGVKYASWLPDAYAAWMWRSYHSSNPPLKLTGPVIEYRKLDGKWGGPECGLGYGGELSSGVVHRFSATAGETFAKVEFRSGDRVLGEAKAEPWVLEGVKLEPGLHALFAVGEKEDGSRVASRPAFAIVVP